MCICKRVCAVCVCECVCMCMCERVCMCVSECMYVCVSVCTSTVHIATENSLETGAHLSSQRTLVCPCSEKHLCPCAYQDLQL